MTATEGKTRSFVYTDTGGGYVVFAWKGPGDEALRPAIGAFNRAELLEMLAVSGPLEFAIPRLAEFGIGLGDVAAHLREWHGASIVPLNFAEAFFEHIQLHVYGRFAHQKEHFHNKHGG